MKFFTAILLAFTPIIAGADIVITKNTNVLTMHENGKGRIDNIVEFKPPAEDDPKMRVQIFVNGEFVATTKRGGGLPWCNIRLDRNGGENTVIVEDIYVGGKECHISAKNVEVKNINSHNPTFSGQNVNVENVVSSLDFRAQGKNLTIKNVTASRGIGISGTDGDDVINVENAYVSNVDYPKPRQARFNLHAGIGDDVINIHGVQTIQMDIQGWGGNDDISLGGSRVTGFALIKGGLGIDTYTDTFPNYFEGGMQFRKIESFDIVGDPIAEL